METNSRSLEVFCDFSLQAQKSDLTEGAFLIPGTHQCMASWDRPPPLAPLCEKGYVIGPGAARVPEPR